MHNHHVDSFTDNCWCDLIDYSSLFDDGGPPPNFYECPPESPPEKGRSDLHGEIGSKACRERERRGKLNDRFLELSAILEPGGPVKTKKVAIIGDAIRLLNQLKAESKEYTEMNKRLMEEIKNLKAEKNEIREEKLKLKADKGRMEQLLKTMNIPATGFTAASQAIYQGEVNKVQMLPSYGFVPMWQYLSPSVRDTSQDEKLRPPAA